MRSHKTYENLVCDKNNHSNNPEIIATNVKNITIVANKISTVEILFYISKAFSIRLRNLCVPIS
jgi:hypothetical protein